ncbi:MAG: hypothetical protein ACRD3A_15185 [Terriglobales bacterium]
MRKLFFDSGRPAGRLFYCLISVLVTVSVLCGAPPPPTPPATTTISDVIYRADGSTAAGTLLITWPAFTTADNRAVPAGSLSLAIGPFGAINLALVPNQGATPPGTYYKVVLKLNDGTTSEEFWVVPTLSPTTISAIRSQVVPQGVALQVVTRQYVDGALATKADNATVVHRTGDEDVGGVKSFSASPTVPTPTTDTAAANKVYVDSAFASINLNNYVLKSGDTMTGFLTLSGNPTQSLHASTKSYVDSQVATRALDSAVVHLAGTETVTGVKTFSSSPAVPTPTTDTAATNKAYVDSVAGGGSSIFVLKAGDTMTGPLTLSGDPTLAGHASNKNYVDTQVGTRALDSAVVHLTGNETIAGIKQFSSSPTVPAPAAAADASNKSYVDTQVGTRALDSAVVHLTGNETVAGIKQFSSSPTVPAPTIGTAAANKAYVDSVAGGGGGTGSYPNINVVADCGLVGDGTTDDGPALQSCINANPGKTIVFPKRRSGLGGDIYATQTAASTDYYSSQRIEVTGNSTKLACENGGELFDDGLGCNIKFAATAAGGLWLKYPCRGCAVVAMGIYGQHSNEGIGKLFYPTLTDDGITVTADSVLLENVAANFWGRHGINVVGDHSLDAGNANLWHFVRALALDNMQDGFFWHGSDSNQGSCLNCNAYGNGHVGFKDSSQLGNVHIAPHTNKNGNDLGPKATVVVSAASRTSNVVTITTSTSITDGPPNAGNAMTVAGVTDSGFNGTFLVCGPPTTGCATPTATSFTYQQTAANASSSGGTARFSTVGEISTTFWDGFYGAYSSTGGGADTWIQPYGEVNQGDGTTCTDWKAGTMVLQSNVGCGIGYSGSTSPTLRAAAGSYEMEGANALDIRNFRNIPVNLNLWAGGTLDQDKRINFLDKTGTAEWIFRSVPGSGLFIYDGAGTYNVLYSSAAGQTRLGSKGGQSTLLLGDTIDFDNAAGSVTNYRLYPQGVLTSFNTSVPHLSGYTGSKYMALYPTGSDTWAIGATSNPVNNPATPIISFADSGKVTTLNGQLVSTLATGTAPLSVTSTTPITNLTLSADSQLPTISSAGKVADSALSSNVVLENQANTYSAGSKQTFQNSASTAGLNLASSTDPSSVAQGDVWVNASDLKFRGASATQTAERLVNKGAANGYASLDGSSLAPSAQLPNPGASAKGGVQSKDCSASGMIQKINTDSTVSCSTTLSSASVVTANSNTTADQNLMSLSLPAGALNTAGRFAIISGAGLYSTAAGQTPTLTFKVKLCTVSGCGSGTVLTLASWTTAATTASASNMPWKVNLWLGTVSTGATGTVEGHGQSTATLGTTAGAAAEVRNDTVTAASSAIDLTAALFLQFTVATSTGSPSNSISQRQGLASAVN